MSAPEEPHVATFVAGPAEPLPADALAAGIKALLPRTAATAVVPLAPGHAVDIRFTADAIAIARVKAGTAALLAGKAVDWLVQPEAHRRKRLLLADMDSTIIGQECIDELADFVGLKAEVAAITEQAMQGAIAFEPALRARVALLKGLDASVITKVLAERITLTSGAPALVRTMRQAGAYAALVSGGFTAFTSVIAARLGFDENRANRLLVEDGRLAGTVAEPILGREAKLAALRDLCARLGIPASMALAVGDGANDLAMIEAAGLGTAFRAKPAVAAAAQARVEHGDLTTLLYYQGFSADEIAA